MTVQELLRQILLSRPLMRVALVALSAVATCAGLAAAFFQKGFVDSVGGEAATGVILGESAFLMGIELHPLIWLMLGFLALLLSLSLAQAVNTVGAYESVVMQRRLSERLYRTVLSLQSSQLRSKTVGEIVAVYTTDIPGCCIFLEQSLPQGFSIVFPILLSPFVLIFYFHLSARLVVPILGLLVLLNFGLAYRQSHFFYLFKQLAADRVGLVNEWAQNIRSLRILSWVEPFEKKIRRVREVETANRVRMLANGQTMNAVASSMTFMLNLIFVESLVADHPDTLTPGTLLALLWVVGIFLTRPFRQMPWFFTFAFDGWTSLKRLQVYLAMKPGFIKVQNVDRPRDDLALQVRGLHLRAGPRSLLKNISFDVRKGEFVALVGEVGSGKTQLLLSLLGESPAEFAAYSISNQGVETMDASALHRHFSFVPQEGFVISATLRENVLFEYTPPTLTPVAADADVESVLKSLRRCEFDPDKELASQGIETEIGERGVNLSGGQRQRISLARLHYDPSPILLFDDCFSALDVDTERRLIERLFEGDWKQATRILATHRLTVLDQVDRILFMKEGQIFAEGTWKELLQTCPEFIAFTKTMNAEPLAPRPSERAYAGK
ncbi:MAG: ABC transporter permease [Bdellovibrio sp.]|nr:MAG: ABC transporter permease [Bdellovibrio sp.]